jgi:hypothetical protein
MFAIDDVTVKVYDAKGEIVPQRVVVSYKQMPFVVILQEIACHGFTSLELGDKKEIRVASLETMITFYFALSMFTKDEKILQFYMVCLCQKLVEMSEVLHRKGGVGPIPSFSIECTGYQKGYATLLKEKFERIAKQKKKQKFASLKRRQVKNRKTMKAKKFFIL